MVSPRQIIATVIHLWHTRPVDCTLIVVATLLTIVSGVFFFSAPTSTAATTYDTEKIPESIPNPTLLPQKHTISVDLSGAVLNPNVYEVSSGARLGDLIKIAGGLSYNADHYFVARNFNMSKYLADQEKIYIPYYWDISNGTFTEEKRILEYLEPYYPSGDKLPQGEQKTDEIRVNINTANSDDLDMLPGVGPTTVQKIISNRPYKSIQELIDKKVIKQSVFDQIQNLLEI